MVPQRRRRVQLIRRHAVVARATADSVSGLLGTRRLHRTPARAATQAKEKRRRSTPRGHRCQQIDSIRHLGSGSAPGRACYRAARHPPTGGHACCRAAGRRSGPSCGQRRPTCAKGGGWRSAGTGALSRSTLCRGRTGLCSRTIGMATTCGLCAKSKTRAPTANAQCHRSATTLHICGE